MAISKQAESKIKQNYNAKPVPKRCSTCKNYLSDTIQTQPPSQFRENGWWEEKNKRCSIGHFAVKKTATCDMYENSP